MPMVPAQRKHFRHDMSGHARLLATIVHHRAVAGFGPAIAEIKSLADLDGGEPRRIVTDRAMHELATAGVWPSRS